MEPNPTISYDAPPAVSRRPWANAAVEVGATFARRLGLPLLSVLLLTLAFAPIGQFYLAWVALVPWLIFVRGAKSQVQAFFLSWVAGTLFFTANMWWMYYISAYGLFALMMYCGVYWGLAALVIRGAGLLQPRRPAGAVGGALLVAAVWAGCEWLRGNLMTGLPWLYAGHTQTPVLAVCQIADFAGVYGVSFVIVVVNVVIALWIVRERPAPSRTLWPASAVAASLVAASLGYGAWRIGQTPRYLSPGPVVLVAQPNWPQSNTGEKGADDEERVQWHLKATDDALRASARPVDLAVWSETMLPPMNHEYLAFSDESNHPETHRQRDAVQSLAAADRLSVISGGAFAAGWTPGGDGYLHPNDRRNVAYYFPPDRPMDDSIGRRYDKNHLVPFGEFIPFKTSLPWAYRFLARLGPPDMADYMLNDGSDNGLTVFRFAEHSDGRGVRFVTPICFEDIDSRICSRMFRPDAGSDAKRADVLVNLTNDGWFRANENAQHVQAARFRSIENRVPTARSVNTGISGFFDSVGRTHDLLPARTTGTAVAALDLDARLTFYTRYGDAFAGACVAATALVAGAAGAARLKRKTC